MPNWEKFQLSLHQSPRDIKEGLYRGSAIQPISLDPPLGSLGKQDLTVQERLPGLPDNSVTTTMQHRAKKGRTRSSWKVSRKVWPNWGHEGFSEDGIPGLRHKNKDSVATEDGELHPCGHLRKESEAFGNQGTQQSLSTPPLPGHVIPLPQFLHRHRRAAERICGDNGWKTLTTRSQAVPKHGGLQLSLLPTQLTGGQRIPGGQIPKLRLDWTIILPHD